MKTNPNPTDKPSAPIGFAPTPGSDLPDGAAIPWIEGVRAMVRDRQYEITQMMDDLDPRKCPIENEAWQRAKRELEPVADLCNRMLYRIRRGESGHQNAKGE